MEAAKKDVLKVVVCSCACQRLPVLFHFSRHSSRHTSRHSPPQAFASGWHEGPSLLIVTCV